MVIRRLPANRRLIRHDHEIDRFPDKNERFLWIPRKRSPRLYDDVTAAFRAHGQTLEVALEEADNEALVTLVASGEGLSFFTESAAPFIRVGAVLKRVRELDVVILGRSVWRATDEEDPLVRSFLEITNSEHSAREVSEERQ